VAAGQVNALAGLFLGSDPFDREKIWNSATNGRYHWGRGGLHIAALSGMEMACWDVMGKACGLPVAKLLGGWNRDRVTPYASTGFFTEPEDGFRRSIEAAVTEGFDLLKIKCGRGLERDLERVRVVDEVAGELIGLMVDLNGSYTADVALRLADELGPRLVWLEEPVPPEDLDGYARIRSRSSVPIASGEAYALRVGFRDLVARRLVDVIQPDVSKCGGLGEARDIVKMAQAWNVRFSPHVWGGAVSVAAALQLCAATTAHPQSSEGDARLLFEYDRSENELRSHLLANPPEVTASSITIPTRPGLGVDLDWDVVARHRIGTEV
jgi:D-galactarolactone cycloisomerase